MRIDTKEIKSEIRHSIWMEMLVTLLGMIIPITFIYVSYRCVQHIQGAENIALFLITVSGSITSVLIVHVVAVINAGRKLSKIDLTMLTQEDAALQLLSFIEDNERLINYRFRENLAMAKHDIHKYIAELRERRY